MWGEREEEWESQPKAQTGGKEDKSQNPSARGACKDCQASELSAPLGWVPARPHLSRLEGGARGRQKWFLGLSFEARRAFLEEAPDVNGRPGGCQPAQSGCALGCGGVSGPATAVNLGEKVVTVSFKADGDRRVISFFQWFTLTSVHATGEGFFPYL